MKYKLVKHTQKINQKLMIQQPIILYIPQPVNVIHLTDTEFIIGDICIPVYDSDLADVLKQLSITQGDYLAFLFSTANRSGDSFKYEADQRKSKLPETESDETTPGMVCGGNG